MKVVKTDFEGLIIIEGAYHEDARGSFTEVYNKKMMNQAGILSDFVQDNFSHSVYGTIRGLHFQKGDFAQAKLVKVFRGKVLDIVVDLRENSPTYLKSFSIELSDVNRRQLFIPRGFAHGFVVISQEADFFYKCDNFYNSFSEAGIIYNDKTLNICWGIPEDEIIISEKDLNLPTLVDYLEHK